MSVERRNTLHHTPASIEQRKPPPGTFTRKLLLLLASSSINHQQIIIIMDKFVIIREYNYSSPSIVETVNNSSDAVAYVNVMRRKNDGYKYHIFQLNEEL